MTRTFRLPDLGEGVAEGELISWHVAVGDDVAEDQPLVEMETDKALVEIPSPIEGQVSELYFAEGDIVPVGEELLAFDEDGVEAAEPETERDASAEEAAGEATTAFARPSTRRLARERGVSLETIEGTGEGGRITDEDVRAAAEATEMEEPTETTAESATPSREEMSTAAGRDRTLATPATRRVAAELGVALDAVPTSEERDGAAVVTVDDVRAFADEKPATPVEGERERREPYRGVRRTIGDRLTESWQTIPHATHYDEIDATALVRLRSELKPLAEERELTLTYLPFVMLAVVRALQAHPAMNASLDEDAEEVVYKQYYHLGVATDTEVGLLVPVIRDVDRKDVFELAAQVEERVTAARDRSIDRSDLQGGTFTITNVGGIGGQFASPIVNPPEVGILALGAITEKPRVVDGSIEPRHVLPVSLSFDHRVVDGAVAARFTNELKDSLARPATLLVE